MAQPLIGEYADGVLDAGPRARVAAHLADCTDCARLAAEMTATRGLLRALPPQQTSSQFEARLAARLAHAPRGGWLSRLAEALPRPSRAALRPALALGAAAAAVAAVVWHPAPAPIVPTPTPTPTESLLVSQCVTQHQSDVAAQPLADPAAQNLASRISDPATSDSLTEENL